MRKTFFKNLFRDVKKTLSRFLSIVIIIAVGVAFYAGVRASSPDMKRSGDYYFNKNNLMDFRLISTLGLTKDDIAEVEKLQRITAVEGAYSLDAVIVKEKRSLVMNINSLPDINGINSILLIDGKRPENKTEAVVEEKFLSENDLKIGDKIKLQSGNESSLEDRLEYTEFEIVGSAQSPLYISAQRQLSSVGSGTVRGFVYILPEVFKSEVYTEIYVRTDNSESNNSLLNNERYKESVADLEKSLKALGTRRSQERYAEVLNTANDKIKEAEEKLRTSKKEAEDKFAEGYGKLEEGRNKLAQGRKELTNSEVLFNQKISKGEKEIAEGKSQIRAAEEQVNLSKREIEAGKLQLASGKKSLEESEVALNSGKVQAANNISSSIGGKVSELKRLMESFPDNQTYIEQYEGLNYIYGKDIEGKTFDSMYEALKNDGALNLINAYFDITALKNNFDKSEAQIKAGKTQLAEQEKLLLKGEQELQAGIAALEENKKKISAAETELNKGRQEGLMKLRNGKADLESAQKEIDENTEKLRAEEDKAKSQFEEGEAKIQESKDKLKDIKNPEWYVLGRSANVGYETYRQDSERINNIGKAFPLIFFLVAALVSLTTMTRMVQEKRTEIGIYKALGYSRAAIVAHYFIYSLTASLIGSLIGISLGFKLFPPLIINAYGSLYTIPETIVAFNTKFALQAALLAVVFTAAAAAASTLGELREVPASLMRPKPPKAGRNILLEKVPFIWKRLSFTKKVTARNLFRYKQRFFMTVIGIAACTGLMITGFGIKAGVRGAMERQFNKIYMYDMQGSLTKTADESDKEIKKNKLLQDSNISSILFTYTKNSSVKKSVTAAEDAYIVVPENKDELNNYIKLNTNGNPLRLTEEGIIITEKLSRLVDKKVGDTVEITLNDKVLSAVISSVTEHYIQHFIYMSPAYYEKLTGGRPEFNNFYGLAKDTSEDAINNTSSFITGIGGIASISFKQNTHIDLNKSMASIDSVVLVLIASAGVLAFVVIYNLTNININERKRELATIKLLGFFNNELASYIYRENIILTVIGALAGIGLGIVQNNLVITSAETNVMLFVREIDPKYFLYSVVLTISFSIIVNLAMYARFDRIDMIESLKSAE